MVSTEAGEITVRGMGFDIISNMSSSVKFPIHAYCRFGLDKGRYANLEKRAERLERIVEELTK